MVQRVKFDIEDLVFGEAYKEFYEHVYNSAWELHDTAVASKVLISTYISQEVWNSLVDSDRNLDAQATF